MNGDHAVATFSKLNTILDDDIARRWCLLRFRRVMLQALQVEPIPFLWHVWLLASELVLDDSDLFLHFRRNLSQILELSGVLHLLKIDECWLIDLDPLQRGEAREELVDRHFINPNVKL